MPYTHFTEKERYVISHMKLADSRARTRDQPKWNIYPVNTKPQNILHLSHLKSTRYIP